MGIVFRQSVKTSIVVFSGAVLGALIIWLSTKYIPDKQQFGFRGNLINQAVLLGQILLVGLNSTMAVYIHRYVDNDKKRKLLITLCMGIPIILGILVAIPYFLMHEWIIRHFQPADIPLMKKYYFWLPIYSLFFILQINLEQFLASQMLVAASAFVREIVLRLGNIVLIVLFAFNKIDFNTLVACTVLIYTLPILIFMFLSLKLNSFGISFDFKSLSLFEYKELFSFTWFHFLLNFSVLLLGYLDVVCIPIYNHKGLSSLPVYSVAVFLSSILQIPNKAMMQPTINVLVQAFAKDDLVHAKSIFKRSSINILIATSCVALLICCNLTNVVGVIRNGYGDIIYIFPILLVGQFVDLATGLNSTVLSITNHYRFNFYASFILVIFHFILLRTLIPIYGVFGAAWATTTILIISNLLKYIYLYKYIDIQPFTAKSWLVVIAAIPALIVGYFLPHIFSNIHHMYFGILFDTALRSLLIVTIYTGMLIWLKPSPDLEEYIKSIRENKRLF